jgi:hypothetical protein
MTCQEKLENLKCSYPFGRWREAYHEGLDQYTKENCDKVEAVLDNLIASLSQLGENGATDRKVEMFRIAVQSLNILNNDNDGSLIETEEREELCELFDEITLAVGLDPDNFGEGEGIASEWRDW